MVLPLIFVMYLIRKRKSSSLTIKILYVTMFWLSADYRAGEPAPVVQFWGSVWSFFRRCKYRNFVSYRHKSYQLITADWPPILSKMVVPKYVGLGQEMSQLFFHLALITENFAWNKINSGRKFSLNLLPFFYSPKQKSVFIAKGQVLFYFCY